MREWMSMFLYFSHQFPISQKFQVVTFTTELMTASNNTSIPHTTPSVGTSSDTWRLDLLPYGRKTGYSFNHVSVKLCFF
jgi:hypothetical protein